MGWEEAVRWMGQVDSQATSFAQDLQNRREVNPESHSMKEVT